MGSMCRLYSRKTGSTPPDDDFGSPFFKTDDFLDDVCMVEFHSPDLLYHYLHPWVLLVHPELVFDAVYLFTPVVW